MGVCPIASMETEIATSDTEKRRLNIGRTLLVGDRHEADQRIEPGRTVGEACWSYQMRGGFIREPPRVVSISKRLGCR